VSLIQLVIPALAPACFNQYYCPPLVAFVSMHKSCFSNARVSSKFCLSSYAVLFGSIFNFLDYCIAYG